MNQIISICTEDKLDEFIKGISDKNINPTGINKLFNLSCGFGSLKIVKWINENAKNINNKNVKLQYENACKNAIRNEKEDVVSYLLENSNDIDFDFEYLFIFTCSNNYHKITELIYSYGLIKVRSLYDPNTNKLINSGKVKHDKIKDMLINYIIIENNTKAFIQFCKTESLDNIKKKYNKDDIFILYDTGKIFLSLSKPQYSEILNWLLSIYKLPTNIKIVLLIVLCQNSNIEVAKKINNELTEEKILNEAIIYNIYEISSEKLQFHIIKILHGFGHKIDNINLLDNIILDICESWLEDSLEHFKWFYSTYEHIFEKNLRSKKKIFTICCKTSNEEIIIWLHEKLKLFKSSKDAFYINCLTNACNYYNEITAEWLAQLYYKYEITTEKFGFITKINFAKISADKKVYRKIIQDKFGVLEKFDKLGIINKINDDRVEDNKCLICMDKPKDLLQLNCKHYSCINCLCIWFLNNKQECTYCKSNIKWSECCRILFYENILKNNNNLIIESNNQIIYFNL
jgi:hypothetical protein